MRLGVVLVAALWEADDFASTIAVDDDDTGAAADADGSIAAAAAKTLRLTGVRRRLTPDDEVNDKADADGGCVSEARTPTVLEDFRCDEERW